MITCRRELLDRALEGRISLMKGKVLDIGGTKRTRRGRFRPPLDAVESWEYVNSDSNTEPDYCCDATKIPLEDETVDTVVMTEVLEYIEHPAQVLCEVARLLSDDGACIISVPLLHPVHGDRHADRWRFTSQKLKELAHEAGFEDVTIEPMGAFWAVLHDLLHVALGYSNQRPNRMCIKALRKILHRCTPIFLWLDGRVPLAQNHINTGYFVTMKKHTQG